MNVLYPKVEVTVSRDCTSFYFKDITEQFDIVSNPYGYDPTGTSCVNPADLDNITVKVTKVGSTDTPVTINVPTTSPTFDATRIPGIVDFQITSTALGYSVVDGIYQFTYSVTDTANSNQVYQAICYVLNDCNLCCALDQKLKDLKSCGTCSDKNTKTINMLYEAYMLKQKAHHLVACHDFTGAQEVIDYLTRLLDLKTCDNCN